MDNRKNEPRSLVMIISSMRVFGSIGVFRRYIPASSAFLACTRGLIGGLFILAFLRLKGRRIRGGMTSRQAVWLVITGILIGINWILLFEAFNYTTVPVATLCYYMQPTIVVLLSPLIFKERLTKKKAVCAAAAIVGMVLVSGVVGGSGSQGGSMKGVLFGLGAALFYATVVMMNKKMPGIDAYQKTMVQLLSAGIVMIPYLLITGGPYSTGGFSARAVILMLIVGIVHTGIAYVSYFGSMDGLRIQTIALLSYIDPVSALFFSAVFLKEPLSALGVVGAVLIIGSAVISETQSEPGA